LFCTHHDNLLKVNSKGTGIDPLRGPAEIRSEARQLGNTYKEKDMIGRKSVVALAVLCALVISAVSVASASATPAANECSSTAKTIDKFGAHCLAVPVGKTANFGHTLVEKVTPITGTNNNTASETTASSNSILAGSLSGVATELQCTGVEKKPGTVATMTNKEVEGAMVAHGEGTLTYTGCTVLKPAGKSCVVKEEMVTTQPLTAISEGAGILNFKPVAGTKFADITIEKCTVLALNNTFPVTGTLKGTVKGATTTTTEPGVTEQNTLFFGGNKAGLGGALTITGKKSTDASFSPLVLT
jgi:hypothetical protein